uniref:NADH-ubiquinone oxidoreductase chain 5 n=1 Tax=Eukaryota sp. BB2 TaxID=1949062 RepID=A0A1X8VEZ3_9EUKA|nr:NADH dehydrogenase subunit 5 [Eukaryota sp. BB2]AQL10475.1 NADH dehydrogenase subunit 5 [Eukaryota sp. BB2]
MYIYPLYFSLISFLISSLTGRFIGTKGSCFITTFAIFCCNISSLFIFYEVCLLKVPCYIKMFEWIKVELLEVSWYFLFDPLTAVMLVIITTISVCAHCYSMEYMFGDPHQPRFMAYLSLFTFFMIILVTANSLLQLFVGWEGVGLCSYLLINFWFTRIQANKSAIKAIFLNKISDMGLTVAICIAFFAFKSLNFSFIFMPISWLVNDHILFLGYPISILNIICFCIVIGAMGKSAQIGLHLWLPDAMEGPTPVSSLIHAATMVTAGIFLIIRCSFFFEFATDVTFLILLIGSVTAFFSSTTGVFQNDLKKIIAYSTCSQIGYMIFACGYSGYAISMFHLSNHAFFKALLFLTAGSIIHSFLNDQDIRKMGGLLKILPISYICLFIGSLSLIGFPYTTGFYSKDILLEVSYLIFKEFHYLDSYSMLFIHILYWLSLHSIVFTCIYSIRVLVLTFYNYYNGFLSFLGQIHDVPYIMMFPLIFLSFASIFVGFLSKDMMVGYGSDFWGNSFYIIHYLDYEFNDKVYKLLPLIVSMYSVLIASICYTSFNLQFRLYQLKLHSIYYYVQLFFNKKWYFDKLYNQYFIVFLSNYAYNVPFKLFDRGSIEIFGPFGIAYELKRRIHDISRLESGFLYHYSGILLNVFIFLLFLYFILAFFIDFIYLPH